MKVEKLTERQAEVIEKAKADIQLAKDAKDATDYYTQSFFKHNYRAKTDGTIEYDYNDWRLVRTLKENMEWVERIYNERLNNICLIQVDTRTLDKFKRMGLVEIIEVGGTWPDKIKLIEK